MDSHRGGVTAAVTEWGGLLLWVSEVEVIIDGRCWGGVLRPS
jgi:hypothetical protein